MRKFRHCTLRIFRAFMLGAIAVCCAAPTVMADELKDGLIVHMHNGKTVKYILEQTPVVTFVGDKLHIESTVVKDDHKLSDVDKFTFDKVSTSLDDLTAGDYLISVIDNHVLLQGFTPGSSVTLTDLQGRIVTRAVVATTGEATVDMTELVAGVYVVATTGGKTFKVLKK